MGPHHWTDQSGTIPPALFPTSVSPSHPRSRRHIGLQSLLDIPSSFTPHSHCPCWLHACTCLPPVQFLTRPSALKLSIRENAPLHALMNILCISILAFIFGKCNCSLHACLSLSVASAWADGLWLLALYILSLCMPLCIPTSGSGSQGIDDQESTAEEREGGMDWERALTSAHSNRRLAGSCSVTRGPQPRALWWPAGVGRRSKRGRVCVFTTDPWHCTAEINATW